MKERIETLAVDVFSVLLFGLPAGNAFYRGLDCIYGLDDAEHAQPLCRFSLSVG